MYSILGQFEAKTGALSACTQLAHAKVCRLHGDTSDFLISISTLYQ